ncbi:MAG TPA: RodZ domain-containing protein [Gaiellales bacterium]|nr:RodZ domain-containing protein [Gaiellales bacterium]
MFEIGSALREARERKGLSFPQVEEDTKIRARYIRALEEEDFGVLPGATYTKGFLRAYADYLGLDGHLFIDEFNSRYHDPRREDDRPIYPPSQRRVSGHRRETSIVLIALAAIVAIASMVFLTVGAGGNNHVNLPPPPTTNPSSSSSSSTQQKQPTTTTAKKRHHAPKTYRITLTATGDSWIYAHKGTPTGPAAVSMKHTDLSSYLMHAGETAQIRATGPIAITIGAPGSITVSINGTTHPLPPGLKFTITRKGISQA